MEWTVHKNQKALRRGVTTGTCAAAAAKAAALLLATGEAPRQVTLRIPAGAELTLPVESASLQGGCARCAVRKDAGDDPDVTDGVQVFAAVSLAEGPGVAVEGGPGVGRVTKPGLACPPGEAAINPVPRRMIIEAVAGVLGPAAGARVEISVPGGEELARRTYNPRLGIVGGLSILGTTGVVEPMSEAALLDSIRLELSMARRAGRETALAVPGNYGADFAAAAWGIDPAAAVKCSNFIGETVDFAAELGFSGFLLVAHAGKLVKVAAGVMNTHSHVADARAEVLTAHAALCGAPAPLARALMAAPTTDEAVRLLDEAGLRGAVLSSVMGKIAFHLQARAGSMRTEAVMFSNRYGILGQTPGAAALLERCGAGKGKGK